MEVISEFIERITNLNLEYCFNPYSDTCNIYDKENAPEIRRENLSNILNSLKLTDSIDIWVGRDLGYKGGRRTGLALTDEVSLARYASHLKLASLKRATSGPAVRERTAANIFAILTEVDVPILTWNVFPLHPHESSKPFSNRQHTKSEAQIGFTFLEELYSIFPVGRVIAIGNDAAKWTRELAPDSIHVRHPSYGGQTEFLAQMRRIYSLKAPPPAQIQLI